MRWAKHVASFMGEMRIAYRISIRKHKEKKLHGRPKHSWKGNIEVDLQETGCIWLRTESSGGLL
jgi:hypothetical protein